MQTSQSLTDLADRLEHNATVVGILPALVVGVAVGFVQPIVGVLVAIICAVGWVLAVRARLAAAPERLLSGWGATPLTPGRQPRLENLLEGLSVTSGVAVSSVSIVDAPGINAMVVAGRDQVSLVVTRGAVEHLGRMELEGLLANLLARVRDGSARYTTTVRALLGTSARADALLARHLGDQREVRSDLAAVDLTRYPPGLLSALAAMETHGSEVSSAPLITRSTWIAPFQASLGAGAGQHGSVDGSAEQPLSLRIAVLAEL